MEYGAYFGDLLALLFAGGSAAFIYDKAKKHRVAPVLSKELNNCVGYSVAAVFLLSIGILMVCVTPDLLAVEEFQLSRRRGNTIPFHLGYVYLAFIAVGLSCLYGAFAHGRLYRKLLDK